MATVMETKVKAWSPTGLAKAPDHIVSSQFSSQKIFIPSYEKEKRPCIEQLLTNEYQRMWWQEKEAWDKRYTTPTKTATTKLLQRKIIKKKPITTPVEKITTPIERRTRSVEKPARSVEKPARSVEKPTKSVEKPTRSVEKPAKSVVKPKTIKKLKKKKEATAVKTDEKEKNALEQEKETQQKDEKCGEQEKETQQKDEKCCDQDKEMMEK